MFQPYAYATPIRKIPLPEFQALIVETKVAVRINIHDSFVIRALPTELLG